MSHRLRRTLLTLALLLLALYVAPQIAPVRNGLLGLALGALSGSGYQVSYGSSVGNLWRGITLNELRAGGRGVDASARSLEVSYDLLALAGGRLPFSVAGSGLRGSIDVAALLPHQAANAPGEPAPAPGQARITPVLQTLSLTNTA